MGRIIDDMVCVALQKAIYARLYRGHRPNEWKPWNEPSVNTLEGGMVCRNDVEYGQALPNSFADIWYPDATGKKRPTIVYFHGGGFVFGDKTTGDPLSAGGSEGKLAAMVREGYNLVNANYALAPSYRLPTQIQQADQLLRYLIDHAAELDLDMSRVCLAGGSAGADMVEMYAACVCNAEYAKLLGVDPVLTRENLRVLVIDEAALDSSVFDAKIRVLLGCALGANPRNREATRLLDAKRYIESSFIPSWINASNEPDDNTGYFITEGRGLKEKLDKIGVPNDLVFFPGAGLPHGYMDRMDSEPHAQHAFARMTAFVREHI